MMLHRKELERRENIAKKETKRLCNKCGCEVTRVRVPCPDGDPACYVLHTKLVCYNCDTNIHKV